MKKASEVNHRKQVISGSIATALQMILGFVVTVFLARKLPPDEFGSYFYLLSIVYTTDGAVMGCMSAAKKRFSESGSSPGEIIGFAVLLVSFFSIIFGIGVWIIANSSTKIQAPFVLTALFFSLVMSNSLLRLYSGTGKVGSKTWIELGRSVLRASLQVSLAIVGFGAIGMVFGMVGAASLSIPVVIYLTGEKIRIPSVEVVHSIWKFARYSVISGIVARTANQIDKVIIGTILTTTMVGQYEVVYRIMMPALLITGLIQSGLFARVSDLYSRGKPVGKEVSKNLAFSSVLSIPIFFGAVALGDQIIIAIFGGDYRGVTFLVIMMGFYKLLESQISPLTSVLGGINRPDISFLTSVTPAVLNIFLGIILASPYGINGVIFATVFSGMIQYIMCVWFVNQLVPDVNFLPWTMRLQFLSGILMFLVVRILRSEFAIDSSFRTILLIALGGVIYLTTIMSLDESLREIAKQSIPI